MGELIENIKIYEKHKYNLDEIKRKIDSDRYYYIRDKTGILKLVHKDNLVKKSDKPWEVFHKINAAKEETKTEYSNLLASLKLINHYLFVLKNELTKHKREISEKKKKLSELEKERSKRYADVSRKRSFQRRGAGRDARCPRPRRAVAPGQSLRAGLSHQRGDRRSIERGLHHVLCRKRPQPDRFPQLAQIRDRSCRPDRLAPGRGRECGRHDDVGRHRVGADGRQDGPRLGATASARDPRARYCPSCDCSPGL